MSLQSIKLTEREKAVLYYHIYAGVDDWKLLYNLADDNKLNKEVKFLDTLVSRWKRSQKVTTFLELIKAAKADQEAEERQRGREEERRKAQEGGESEATETKPEAKPTKIIDYSDPKNRQHLYNTVIANSKDDPKTQLDAAKMFEQIQRDDREAAKAQKQSRFYLPIRCESCILYQRAKKKTTK